MPTFPGQAPRSLGLLFAVAGVLVPARRARADQPDLALGAVPHRLVDERRPARLVPRLADRRAAARAGLRRRRSATTRSCRTRSGAAPLFPLVVFGLPLRLAVARAAVDAATPASTTCSTGRATRRCRTAIGVGVLTLGLARLPRRIVRPGRRAVRPQLHAADLDLPGALLRRPAVAAVIAHRVCVELRRGEAVRLDAARAELEARAAAAAATNQRQSPDPAESRRARGPA